MWAGGNWLRGKLGLVLMGGAMFNKSLIPFSVDGWICVSSLLFDLRPNYGGGNEDNGNLLQKAPRTDCYLQCPRPCSRPPLTHISAGDSLTLRSKSGSISLVGSLLLSPGSWCTKGSVCALQESVSPVLCKFWGLYGGVNGDFLQEGLCHTRVCWTQSSCPCRADPYLHRRHSRTQRQVWLSLCRFSWYAQGFVWDLQASLVGMGLDSKCNFTPPILLLGHLLCPWMWGIFFLVGSNILLSTAVQEYVVILEFLQEKMSTCPSSPPP